MRNLVSVPHIPCINTSLQTDMLTNSTKGLSAKMLIPRPQETVVPWKCAAVSLLRENLAKSKLPCQLLWKIPTQTEQGGDVLCQLWHPFWFLAWQSCTYSSQLLFLLPLCAATGTVCLCKLGFWGSFNAAALGFVLAEHQSPGYICILTTQCAGDLSLSIFTYLQMIGTFSLGIKSWKAFTCWHKACQGTEHLKAS